MVTVTGEGNVPTTQAREIAMEFAAEIANAFTVVDLPRKGDSQAFRITSPEGSVKKVQEAAFEFVVAPSFRQAITVERKNEQFEVTYESHRDLKSQALAEFVILHRGMTSAKSCNFKPAGEKRDVVTLTFKQR